NHRENAAPIARFTREDAEGQPAFKATLAIDIRDCIGCEICVAHCTQGVLKMVDGKALVDLTSINHCNMDGECVDVCPTDVVTLAFEDIAPADAVALKPHTHDSDGKMHLAV
ncbi:MAG: 4Fe-4S ferredoxin iron-sulfur binding protein, partial [Phycisphaerales bacterium]|nr:4Fe-4S ferredoxin iron-sulfur binding protein [Phycisphaerales bacterium]